MIRNIKLLLVTLLSAASLSLVAAPAVLAADLFEDACSDNPNATVCQDAGGGSNPIYGPDGIVTVVVNILSIIIGVAAVIVIIIAGIQYMLSTGDPTKVNNSKNAILYAVVGLAIAAAARAIVVFVLSKL